MMRGLSSRDGADERMRGAAHGTAPRPIPNRLLDPVGGDRCPRRLAPATLESQVRSKARKPTTVNKAAAALSSLGAWLVEEGACADTPARRLRSMGEQIGPPKALSPTVVTRLLDAAHHTDDLRDAVVLEILAFSGMRASEVAAMALEDLDVGLRTTWVQ